MHVDAHGPGNTRLLQVGVQFGRGFEHDSNRIGAVPVRFPPAMSKPIEAVVWDYGGVISSPLFRGVDRFEIDMGYPPGSILELLFGEAAYIGVEGRAASGSDPGDGAASADRSAVTHDWHRLEVG